MVITEAASSIRSPTDHMLVIVAPADSNARLAASTPVDELQAILARRYELIDLLVVGVVPVRCGAHYGSSAVNEHASSVLVGALVEAHNDLSVAARVLICGTSPTQACPCCKPHPDWHGAAESVICLDVGRFQSARAPLGGTVQNSSEARR